MCFCGYIYLKHLLMTTHTDKIRATVCKVSLHKGPEGKSWREKRKRLVLNNAEGISSSFKSGSSCCPPLPLSILSFSLSPPPLVAVFSAALHPGPGSVSMVTGGSKASAGQPGLWGTQHRSSLEYCFLLSPSGRPVLVWIQSGVIILLLSIILSVVQGRKVCSGYRASVLFM